MINSKVIHIILMMILIELISLESPTSPPHFSVNIGSKDAKGEKSRMTRVFLSDLSKGSRNQAAREKARAAR